MSINSITFNYAGIQKTLAADDIPDVDKPMHSFLAQIQPNSPPPESLMILPERVKDLTDTAALAHAAIRSRRIDKVKSVLATAVAVILIAATALGFMTNPMIGVSLLVLTLGYLVLCHLATASIARKEQRELENCLSMYPLSVLFSPFILSNLLWTRASFLESAANASLKEISAQLPEAAQYWDENGYALAKRLKTEKIRAEETISNMQSLPIRSLQGEKDLENYLSLLKRTEAEIEKGRRMA